MCGDLGSNRNCEHLEGIYEAEWQEEESKEAGKASSEARAGQTVAHVENVAMMKTSYECANCQWVGDKSKFEEKILSIMWRPQHDIMHGFVQIKCPKCHNLISVVFETLDENLKS